MSLLDILTGGENQKAEADLNNILQQIQGIQTPTAAQLQLTPMEQYSDVAKLDPALMEAAQAGPSAFNNENLSSVPNATMQQVLARENEIATSGGMTPQEQAAIAQAEESANRNTAGQRGAIAQDFAGRGIPQSLISAALQNATAGQNAQQAHMDALQGQAGAANNAMTALSNEGALAGKMQEQNTGQANTVAAAQDALSKFNTANTQQSNMANQGAKMAANTYNTTTEQNTANKNVDTSHQTQIQNQVEAPQEAAGLALQKGQELSGIGQAQAGQATAAGQQQAGLYGGLIGAGATMGASAMAPSTVIMAADGGEIPPANLPAVPFVRGGAVPGHAMVPGNDGRNDTVPARLSPGEFVVPRTAMARPEIRNFLAQNVPTPRPPADAHPSDVASILKALSMLRGGAEA